MAGFRDGDPRNVVTVTVTGVAEFLRAVKSVEDHVQSAQAAQTGAKLVEGTARRRSRSRRVRRTARIVTADRGAMVRFGAASVPWTAPSHFGHGSPSRPRAQGGYMRPNPFLYDAVDREEPNVVDLFVDETNNAIRKAGLG